MRPLSVLIGVALSVWLGAAAHAEPFTYQGHLEAAGSPATGSYELTFVLYDAESAGGLVAGPVVVNPVAVDAGLFAVEIEFPDGSFSDPVWLEVTARNLAGGGAETLAPRQSVTAAPRSIEPWPRSAGGIHADGRVGIGIAPSSAHLEVDASSDSEAALRLNAPGTSTGQIQFSSPNGVPGMIGFANNGNRRDIRFGDTGLNLVTSSGSGKPIDNNGLFIDEQGEVGIGTTFPGAKLEVLGDVLVSGPMLINNQFIAIGAISSGDTVYAENFRYNTARESVISIAGAEFQPLDNNVNFSNGFDYEINQIGAEVNVRAPVALPHGATITRVELYGRRRSGGSFEPVRLQRISLPTDEGDILFQSPGGEGAFDSNVTIPLAPVAGDPADYVVDNSLWAYAIYTLHGDSRTIRGAAIWYTMPGPE